MFTIRFVTDTVIPDTDVVLRISVDNWTDRAGEYVNGAWQFVLDEQAFPAGMQFKFVIPPGRWMLGGHLTAGPQGDGAVLSYNDAEVQFPFVSALVTEDGVVARTLLNRNVDPAITYDVIVVGSGIGGVYRTSTGADVSRIK